MTDTEGKHIGKITLDVAEGPIAIELMNPLHTKGDCETRWGSFMECIKRFKALRPYIKWVFHKLRDEDACIMGSK